MVTNYILYSKRIELLSFASVASALINVTLLIVLTNLYGIAGAPMAFSIAMGVRIFLVWRVAQTRHPMPWFDFTKSEGGSL
jgi:O-antigen/teichoic acid export membrane protein